MKILFYINSLAPAGGIERVVSRHIWYFSDYASIYLLTKDSKDSFYPIPETIERIKLNYNKTLNMKSFFLRIIQTICQLISLQGIVRKTINDYKPDIIYCCSPINLIELFFYGIQLESILITEHGSYFGYNRIYRIAKRLIYPKCLLIVAQTTMDYGIYKNWTLKARYIPNPLPFEQNEKAKLKNKTVLTVGRLTDDKQHSMLLDIWKAIHDKIPVWKLRIIGEGENKKLLLQKIIDLGLQDSVEIVPPTKEIITEYCNTSIFVLTSRAEGFGMVLAEAMECGVPCIAFDCPSGPRDIITDTVDGFLIEPFDIKLYIERVIQLMEDDILRKKMGHVAAVNIKKFRESIVREQWKILIKEVNHE